MRPAAAEFRHQKAYARLQIIGALRSVDGVFLEESLEAKRENITAHGAQVLVMGDDWAGKFDELGDICEVVYLPRTPSISTTAIIEKVAGPAADG